MFCNKINMRPENNYFYWLSLYDIVFYILNISSRQLFGRADKTNFRPGSPTVYLVISKMVFLNRVVWVKCPNLILNVGILRGKGIIFIKLKLDGPTA